MILFAKFFVSFYIFRFIFHRSNNDGSRGNDDMDSVQHIEDDVHMEYQSEDQNKGEEDLNIKGQPGDGHHRSEADMVHQVEDECL